MFPFQPDPAWYERHWFGERAERTPVLAGVGRAIVRAVAALGAIVRLPPDPMEAIAGGQRR